MARVNNNSGFMLLLYNILFVKLFLNTFVIKY